MTLHRLLLLCLISYAGALSASPVGQRYEVVDLERSGSALNSNGDVLFRNGTIQTADGVLVIPEFGGPEFEGVTGTDFWEGFNDSRNATGYIKTTSFYGDGRAIAFFNGSLVNVHTPVIESIGSSLSTMFVWTRGVHITNDNIVYGTIFTKDDTFSFANAEIAGNFSYNLETGEVISLGNTTQYSENDVWRFIRNGPGENNRFLRAAHKINAYGYRERGAVYDIQEQRLEDTCFDSGLTSYFYVSDDNDFSQRFSGSLNINGDWGVGCAYRPYQPASVYRFIYAINLATGERAVIRDPDGQSSPSFASNDGALVYGGDKVWDATFSTAVLEDSAPRFLDVFGVPIDIFVHQATNNAGQFLISKRCCGGSYSWHLLSPTDTVDVDADGVIDQEDNCPFLPNPAQLDQDLDGVGDICDADLDGDLINNDIDNCPSAVNPLQTDTDQDGLGDACDDDSDGDGVSDGSDNCPSTSNVDQADLDLDAVGDACDVDDDNDGIDDVLDNCPTTPNVGQGDNDADGFGDACDADDDNDGVEDVMDNCPNVFNADQLNSDGFGAGDACNDSTDQDGDNWDDSIDNCVDISNPDQNDYDGDGEGDACDADQDGDGIVNGVDSCPTTSLDAVANSSGCSFVQLCPCSAPRQSSDPWKSKGQYVSCVTKAAQVFVAESLMNETEKGEAVSSAALSLCGE